MRTWTIGIAGCGLAGLAAALLLHRDGHRVTLFERFSAPRPVGSGLMVQSTGLAVLRALELDHAALAKGARIDRLFGKAVPSGRTVLDVRYAALGSATRFGIGIHRAALFDVVYQAVIAAGVPVETERTVTAAPADAAGRRSLTFAGAHPAGPFDLVVDALGLDSPLIPAAGRKLAYGALWASLDWPQSGFDIHALEQRYVRASTMAGVLPIGIAPGRTPPQAAFFWSLRADHLEAWRQRGLDAWKSEVLQLWPATAPLLDQIETPQQLTFARYAHRTTMTAAEPGLVHIGDAWHAASPQLGQGANMAFLDAYALTTALRETHDASQAAQRAVASRRRHVGLYQFMSALFTPVYQSDGHLLPLLRDRIAGPLSGVWPAPRILAAMVSGVIGNPLKALGLRKTPPDLELGDIAAPQPDVMDRTL